MEWLDLSYYQIYKIKDENLKNKYIKKYYLFLTNIQTPICEDLKKRNLKFSYSLKPFSTPIKLLANELRTFCLNNGYTKEEIRKIINDYAKKKESRKSK